jgi:hypothetical protein
MQQASMCASSRGKKGKPKDNGKTDRCSSIGSRLRRDSFPRAVSKRTSVAPIRFSQSVQVHALEVVDLLPREPVSDVL